jgi:nucleoside-diphosphate-sugar epimerase
MKRGDRIIIIGSGGFISSGVEDLLIKNNFKVYPLPRIKIDLKNKFSINKLNRVIKKNDVIFFAAAEAPVKNLKMLLNNLLMAKNVSQILRKKKPKYLLYLSSDSVYADSKNKLSENSELKPESMHGIMHLMREEIFKNLNVNFCIVRPTLVYGKKDPHNGYGPNQFIRSVKRKKIIELFGKGEELRDHIWIDDVCNSIYNLIVNRKTGVFNLVTGRTISFKKISHEIINVYNKKIKLILKKRNMPMPHNGYRAFRKSKILFHFPKLKFKTFNQAVKNLL